jgi:hypothetical protein
MVQTTLIFDHDRHATAVAEKEGLGGVFPENYSCTVCHAVGQAKSAESAKPCLECHTEDTEWAEEYEAAENLAWAVSYLEAMHGTCVECHRKEAEELGRETLGDCSTCHRSLTSRRDLGEVVALRD